MSVCSVLHSKCDHSNWDECDHSKLLGELVDIGVRVSCVKVVVSVCVGVCVCVCVCCMCPCMVGIDEGGMMLWVSGFGVGDITGGSSRWFAVALLLALVARGVGVRVVAGELVPGPSQ